MTFENRAKGTPAVTTPSDTGPSTAMRAFIGRLRDSVTGLRTAAGLIEDDSLTRFVAGLVERREVALDSLIAVAADTGMQWSVDSTGTITEAARRGWMRLKGSIGGDDAAIVETAIDGEQDFLDEVDDLLSLDLPRAVEGQVRSLAGEVESDITRLSEWRRTLDAGDTQ